MKSSTTTQFNQGSLILLLPLLCLALITSGLDPRGTQHFSEDLRQWLLNFSAVFSRVVCNRGIIHDPDIITLMAGFVGEYHIFVFFHSNSRNIRS